MDADLLLDMFEAEVKLSGEFADGLRLVEVSWKGAGDTDAIDSIHKGYVHGEPKAA